MTFQDWVRYFEQGCEEKFTFNPELSFCFNPDKGFIFYKVEDGIFCIDQTATKDHLYWVEWARKKAKSLGCKLGRTVTRRNPEAFARLLKAKIIKRGYDDFGRSCAIIEWEENK